MDDSSVSPPPTPLHGEREWPRATSALSHVSNRSRRSSGSGMKLDLTETTKDKKRLHTKADPSKALNEAQPAAVALEASNLDDIRLMQHKDHDGNIITDPDRSNPTRHRLERPLDTIRSFQAAAEGTSSNRRSSYSGRPPSQFGGSQMGGSQIGPGFDGGHSRRSSSYYGAQTYSPSPQRPRPGYGGYYRNSSYGMRPDSYVEEGPGSSQQWGSRGPMRYSSAPTYYQQMQVAEPPLPSHTHQPSYETMTSGSDENTNKSTNPSSQNSSFDQLHQVRKPEEPTSESQHEYNSHFAPVTAPLPLDGGFANSGYDAGYGMPRQHPQLSREPRLPVLQPQNYAPNNPRHPISLNHGPVQDVNYDTKKSPNTKRQSWLKRAFSRKE